MKKVILITIVVVLALAMAIPVFADPAPPNTPPTDGACNMRASVWLPNEDGEDTGPGNHNGVQDEDRGMIHVHTTLPHGEPIGGANMSSVADAHCG
jgi:hypothetical protein